jgi:hypothetical protein
LLEEGIYVQNENKAFLNYQDVEAVDMFKEEEWPEEKVHSTAGFTFPELYDSIDKIIAQQFTGKCFPKLNGKCPAV